MSLNKSGMSVAIAQIGGLEVQPQLLLNGAGTPERPNHQTKSRMRSKMNCCKFHFLKNLVCVFPVGVKGKLSLLDISSFFPGT